MDNFYLIKLIEVIKIKKFYTARYEPIFMRSVVKPNILKPLLEYILEKEIVELEILNPNLVQDYFKVRGQRLDVLVKTKEDIINVEINSNYNEEILIRNLHYIFKLASENTKRGNKYKIDNKIVQINLNFSNSKYEKCEYLLYDKRNELILTDYIKIYNIGIDKYIKNYYNNGKKFTKGEDLIIMLDLDKKELEELSEKSDIVDNFKDDVIKANEDEFVVEWISREEEQKQYEEVMYEKGLNQGKQQGLLEGIEQGIEKGLKKGIEKTNIDNARKMLKLNMDLDVIRKITGLTIEQIKSLRN